MPSFFDLGARGHWLREGIQVGGDYSSVDAAPTASAVRFTYTVPIRKRFIMSAGMISIQSVTQTGTASLAEGMLRINTVTGPFVLIGAVLATDLSPWNQQLLAIPPGLIGLPGDVIDGLSYVSGAGASFNIRMTLLGFEIDY